MTKVSAIPQALRDRPQWVVWRDEDGRKMPYDAKTRRPAKSTDPATWATFQEAVAAARNYGYTGIGYVFSADDPYVGIDLDDCLEDDGTIAPWADEIVQALHSYTEISPSGRGLKIWVAGDVPGSVKTEQIEIYPSRRYFTVTGRHYDATPTTITEANGALRQLYDRLAARREQPQERLTAADRRDAYAQRALGDELAKLSRATEGTRNSQLNASAFALGQLIAADMLNESTVMSALEGVALAIGLTGNEVTATIRSGISAGKREARTNVPNFHDHEERRSTSAGAPAASSAPRVPESFAPILPLASFDLPPFPVDVFPTWLREYVLAVSEATQTPVDLAAMLALSVLSTCCARYITVSPWAGWHEPVNLYTITVLPPAAGKSPVFRAMTLPIVEHEARLLFEARISIAQKQNERDMLRHRLEGAKRDAGSAKDEYKRREALATVNELTELLAVFDVPALPRYIVDDISSERLQSMIADQGGRIAVLSPEGDIFAIMAGRYSDNMPNFGVYLKAHAGDELRVDRAKDKDNPQGRAQIVYRPALTMGLTIQPDVLRSFADKKMFRGQGLLARFLYAIPRSLVGRRNMRPSPVPQAVQDAYAQHVLHLLNQIPIGYFGNCGNYGNDYGDSDNKRVKYMEKDLTLSVPPLSLDSDASTLFSQFSEWLEPQLDPDHGQLGSIADWGGKLRGHVLRIAGLLHCAEYINHPSHNSHNPHNTIGAATMQRAVAIANYLIAHAQAAFFEIGSDPDIEAGRRIIQCITDRHLSTFTKRDLYQMVKGAARFRRASELDPVLELLCDHGYLRAIETDERPGPGRKPSQRYEVNPALYQKQQTVPTQAIAYPVSLPAAPTSAPAADTSDDEKRAAEALVYRDLGKMHHARAAANQINDPARRATILSQIETPNGVEGDEP